ncbi:hypothetical protein ACFLZB_04540 [Nanoarchaeota archaeon]
MKAKKCSKWSIIVLAVLLAAAVIFIAVTQIQSYNEKKSIEIYQTGMQVGYETAVRQLMEELATCQAVPVFADNVTIEAVAVECLQAPMG